MSSAPPSSSGQARQWLRNVGAGYGDTAVGAVVFVLLTPVIVSRLGVEAYAAWVLSHSITFYLRFFDLGFGEAQVRLHARFAERARRDLVSRLLATVTVSLVLSGALAALLGIALAFGAPSGWLETSGALEGDLRIVIAILACNLLISIPASALERFYEGAQRFDLLGVRSMAVKGVGAALQLALLLQGHGIVALAAVELGMTCLALAIDCAMVRRIMPGLLSVRAAFHRRIWRRIKHFALWTSVDDLIAEGTAHLDELLVVVFLPLSLLTPYALCLALAGALLPIVRPITETFFPLAAALHARHRTPELARLLVMGTKIVTAIAIPFAIGLAFFGNDVLALWVPDAASQAPRLVITLLAGNALLTACLWTSGIMLLALNRIRLVVILNLAEVALEIGLIALLAPRHGLLGVAIASGIANVTVGLLVELPLMCGIVRLGTLRFLGGALGRLVAAALPLIAAAWLLRRLFPDREVAHLAAIAVALGVVWIAGLLLVGTSRAERGELRSTWRKLRDADAGLESS
jgi:O-antigen/teichoic acid export membrane protein